MSLAEIVGQAAWSAKSLTVVLSLSAGAFIAGAGAMGAGYTSLPDKVATLQAQRVVADSTLRYLSEGLEEAKRERTKILCLVRLTATGEVLSPLEVTERCP
jgi:hypothetical protein